MVQTKIRPIFSEEREEYLAHYGVLGMKWGVRNAETRRKYANAKKSGDYDSFGKSRKTNVLYITGPSGSGKTTLAKKLMDRKTSLIQLDGYEHGVKALQNKDFNAFLKESGHSMRTPAKRSKAIKAFSYEMFDKGKRVIVEGTQVKDGYLTHPSETDPMITMKTGVIKSTRQAFKRDNRGNIVTGLRSLDDPVGYLKWQRSLTK